MLAFLLSRGSKTRKTSNRSGSRRLDSNSTPNITPLNTSDHTSTTRLEHAPSKQYFIHRPRPLQYRHGSDEFHHVESQHELLPIKADGPAAVAQEQPIADVIATAPLQRSQLDLFIDLIFVGIVGNLSEHFSEVIFGPKEDEATPSGHDVGMALLQFLLLFLVTWRVWNSLRNFTNMWFLDDVLQRLFIIWILILAIVIGNTAPWTFATTTGGNTIVSCYLIIRASFLAIEGFYVIFHPFLRREWLASFVLALPAAALWIGSLYVPSWGALAMVAAAVVVENCGAFILQSPLIDHVIGPKGYRKTIDIEHYTERIGAFYVIILGEGVLLLIKGSPLGEGVTEQLNTGIAAFAIYFALHLTYFRSNHSSHAFASIRQAKWKLVVWQFCHMLLFSALLLLDVVNLFVVQHLAATGNIPAAEPTEADPERRWMLAKRAEPEQISEEALPHYMKIAQWTGSAALAIVLFALTCLNMLNSSSRRRHDKWTDYPLVRLLPRTMIITILPFVPLFHLSGGGWMGVNCALLMASVSLEVIFMVNNGGGFWEGTRS